MSAVTDLQRRIRGTRAFRAGFAALTVVNALVLAADIAMGSFVALFAVVSLAFCVLMTVRNTRLIGTMRLQERELTRPRMTAEDYRHLREMEAELGWEPSEVPAVPAGPVEPVRGTDSPVACECSRCGRRGYPRAGTASAPSAAGT